MDRKIVKELKDHIQDIKKDLKFKLEKVVLFGSYATDYKKEKNDIDLIVISNDFKDKDLFAIAKLTKKLHRTLVKKLDKPVDLLFYSPEEWEKEEAPIIKIAKKEGIEVYSDESL